MALDTFNPPVMPSPGTARRHKLNILEAEFGDGYNQPTPNGLNHMCRQIELRWNVLTDDQADAIMGFLLSKEGTTPFYYHAPRDALPVKWTCREWTDDVDDQGFRKVSANFEQSFTTES